MPLDRVTRPGKRNALADAARGTGRWLRSSRLAIILIVLFLLACLAGNLIPQENVASLQAVQQFQGRYPWAEHLLTLVAGHQIFTSPWFIALTALLALNTLACSLSMLPRIRRSLPALSTDKLLACGTASDPATAAHALAVGLRRSGLSVASHEGPDAYVIEAGAGRSGPVWVLLFHFALVLVFAAACAGALLSWQGTLVLSEGEIYEFGQGGIHGIQGGPLAHAVIPPELRAVRLDKHFPLYSQGGYASDAASDLTFMTASDPRPARLYIGRPLRLAGLDFYQSRRYGVDVHLDLRMPGAGEGVTPVKLPFVSGLPLESQRRLIILPTYGGKTVEAALQVVPTTVTVDRSLPLDRRFVLRVSIPSVDPPAGTPAIPAGGSGRTVDLRAGEPLTLGQTVLRFTGLNYWTSVSLGRNPATPLIFASAWLAIGALGLAFWFVPRRVHAEVAKASGEIRYATWAAKTNAFFAARIQRVFSEVSR